MRTDGIVDAAFIAGIEVFQLGTMRLTAPDGRIDPARLVAMSKGDTAPIADNATEEGRAKNRRIEITIDYEGATPPANN